MNACWMALPHGRIGLRRLGLALGLVVACAAPARAADDALARLRGMVDAERYDAAYTLALKSLERMGQPDFDLLYGIAAINAQKYPEGVFALERFLLSVPTHDRARIELARGYFELGDHRRAAQEFTFVLGNNPPKPVADNIRRYLAAMRVSVAKAPEKRSVVFVEWGLGHDSNVNSGTYNDEITLVIGPVALSSGSQAVDTFFMQTSAGGQWQGPLRDRIAYHAGIYADHKHGFSASQFDTAYLSGYAGVALTAARMQYKFTLSDGQMWLDAEPYRNTVSLSAEAVFADAAQGYSASALLQAARLDHAASADTVRDANLLTLGVSAQKTYKHAWKPTAGVQLSYSEESNAHARDDLSRDLTGLRLFAAVLPAERWRVSAGLGLQHSRYGAADVLFGSTRADDLASVNLDIDYALRQNWLLRLGAAYTHNDSNQSLYDYQRAVFSVKTRYVF